MNNQNGRCVRYTQQHNDIVEKGVSEILKVLNGTDTQEKESLLFCLDRYLDPYFKCNLPYAKDIFHVLEEQLFCPHPIAIKEDILNLLALYCTISLEMLASDIDKLEPELTGRAKEVLAYC